MFALGTTVLVIWWFGLTHPLETIFLTYIGGVEPFVQPALGVAVFGEDDDALG